MIPNPGSQASSRVTMAERPSGSEGYILVSSVSSPLGVEVVRCLRRAGHEVLATCRTPTEAVIAEMASLGCRTEALDLSDFSSAARLAGAAGAMVLLPNLRLSGALARSLPADLRPRLVLVSSANVTVDFASPLYAELRAEEARLTDLEGDIAILRPTLIYGHPADGNLSTLLRLAMRYPLLPMPGMGRARQQPVHVNDLATALAHLATVRDVRGAFTAGGPVTLSSLEMYRAVARAARPGQRPAWVVPLPVSLLAAVARVVSLPLRRDHLARSNTDRVPPPGTGLPGWQPKIDLDTGLAGLAAVLRGVSKG